MTLGQKITGLRKSMRFSQEQLAEKIGVCDKIVSLWESEQSLPTVREILKLSLVFNVSTDELLKDNIPLNSTYTKNLANFKRSVVFKGKYFGTDGFRGEANVRLTAMHAYKIGRFLGWYYSKTCAKNNDDKKARIVIGKDTRRSSYMLEYAIVAGITASGADAYMLHVTTTPSVSYAVRQERFDCGVMISASHNPYYDNGIKLVNRAGEKMDDYTLALIENYIDGELSDFDITGDDLPLARREHIGEVIDFVAGRNRYVGFLISVAANSYRKLKVALDCANGSAWMIARAVFSALGAQVYVINAEPDGLNINEHSGSTHIDGLCEYVRDNKLDVGFAFDGDADRCIAVDDKGNIVNGDHIMYIIARRLRDKDLLPNNSIATTIMSNMGLYRALDEAGIGYVQTTVGDRYVHEAMLEKDYYLGGEQSGHIIIRKYATTGDGILTALILLEEMVDKKSSLYDLAQPVTMYPQAIINVVVTDKAAVAGDERVGALVKEIAQELGKDGRILLRESGTEPIIRIMVESGSQKTCETQTRRVADFIKELGYCK